MTKKIYSLSIHKNIHVSYVAKLLRKFILYVLVLIHSYIQRLHIYMSFVNITYRIIYTLWVKFIWEYVCEFWKHFYLLLMSIVHTHRHAESSMLTGVFSTLNGMAFISRRSSWSWCFGVCSTFYTRCLSIECLVKVCRTEWAWWQPSVRELARWTFCCNEHLTLYKKKVH